MVEMKKRIVTMDIVPQQMIESLI